MNLEQLCQTFVNLRKRWPHDWPGLPRVVSSALQQLGQAPGGRLPPRSQSMFDCVTSIAERIELDGAQKSKVSQEPSYHNRLHIADTVVALTTLLLAQRSNKGQSAPSLLTPHEWQMFLAICSHDLFHSGKINQFTSQIEGQSVASLRPLMQKCGVFEEDQKAVGHMILQTDPTLVKESHHKVRGMAFDDSMLPCQTVLVQEADIMASSMPGIGDDLTLQLSDEWRSVDPSRAMSLLSKQSRIFFLREFALFSSPASQSLGIQSVIDRQIKDLTQAIS